MIDDGDDNLQPELSEPQLMTRVTAKVGIVSLRTSRAGPSGSHSGAADGRSKRKSSRKGCDQQQPIVRGIASNLRIWAAKKL